MRLEANKGKRAVLTEFKTVLAGLGSFVDKKNFAGNNPDNPGNKIASEKLPYKMTSANKSQETKLKRNPRLKSIKEMERAMGLEPTTITLAT